MTAPTHDPLLCGLPGEPPICPGCRGQNQAKAMVADDTTRQLVYALGLPRQPAQISRDQQMEMLLRALDLEHTCRKHPDFAANLRTILQAILGGGE